MPPAQSNILIVDDAEINLMILEEAIRSMGHHPVPVASGEAALEAIESAQPDLILLDIVLPGLDGFDVLQKLKQDPILCSIPVIMISSLDETESVVKCIQLGAEDYITKPFSLPLLEARVNRVLEKLQASLRAEQLGRYTLDEKIGEGGMAEVYLAHHALLRRPTAVKVLKREMVSEESLTMFEHEVQITSKLTHPNTIVVFDYGRTPEGCFYYAMEYLDGISLQTLVENNGPVPEERVIHILKQVCGSLAEAHENKLIHRDIKPANIMLCNRGGEFDVVKVLDFGIVQAIKDDEDSPQEEYALGTPAYMPPESLKAGIELDGRSDLYSLGLVGYYLLTGRSPFNLENLEETVEAQLNQIPQSPSNFLSENLSPDLDALILQCLEKDMDNRPENARSLCDSLESCQSSKAWDRSRAEAWWTGNKTQIIELSRKDSEMDTIAKTMAVDMMIPRDQES